MVYVRSRPYKTSVDKVPALVSKERMTKQGLRDLNYYGPRVKKGVAGAMVAEEKIAPEAQPAVAAAIEAPDEGATK